MNTDRNLLFGVLALQMEFITVQQFADVCAGWATRKDAYLGDLLIERGWIKLEERDEVERLLKRKLEKKGGDERAILSTLADYDVRDVLRDLDDEQIHESLADLDAPSGTVEYIETIDHVTEERTHHELYDDYKEGGLGRVWRARDKILNREVALKEIRPDRRASPNALRRFKIEAQVTSQLDHPNIVSVYELASPKDGNPFYTMRYIRGKTLGDAIRVLHDLRRDGKPIERKLRDLMNIFVDVCNAIAFANDRGVIHRDLKPANVVLGRHGEVAVLDWGLLKIVDRDLDEWDEDSVSDVVVDEDLLSDQTIPGAKMGTYQYMAPEQARGELKLIDRRTDVYGLGAILFRILTGRAPHLAGGRSSLEVLEYIANEASPRVDEYAAWAPKPLAAICAKAMSRGRKDRYGSAEELAEDVRRWLADEPIDVFPEPWPHRAARWMRRHRSMTVSIVASLAFVTFVSVIAVLWINAALKAEKIAKRLAVQAQAREEQANQEAVAWFRQSRDTVDAMLTGVSDALSFSADQKMRRALLQRAADYYRKLADEKDVNDELRVEGGRALVRLGNAHLLLDEFEPAIAAFDEAQRVFREVAERSGQQVDIHQDIAVCLGRLGVAYDNLRDIERAEQVFGQAVEAASGLPDSPDGLSAQARLLIDYATLKFHQAELDQAEQLLQQAIEKAERLKQAAAEPRRFVPELTMAASLRGEVLIELGRSEEAVAPLEKAHDHYIDLLGVDRDNPVLVEHSGYTSLLLAKVLRAAGRYKDALVVIPDACKAYEQLALAMPSVPVFVEHLAVARTLQARTLETLGRNEEAASALESAAALMERRFQMGEVGMPQWESDCQIRTNLGHICTVLGQDELAQQILTAALTNWEQVKPLEGNYAQGVGFTRRNLGRLLHRQGDLDGAKLEYTAAIASFQNALAANPQDLPSRDGLALCYEHLGDWADEQKSPDDAAAQYALALAQRDQLPAEAEYTHRRVQLLLKLGRTEDVAQALTAAKDLVARQPENADYLTALGAACCLSKDWPGAIDALTQAADDALSGSVKPQPHFWLAITYAHRNGPGDKAQAQRHLDIATERVQQQCPGDVDVIRLQQKAEKEL